MSKDEEEFIQASIALRNREMRWFMSGICLILALLDWLVIWYVGV